MSIDGDGGFTEKPGHTLHNHSHSHVHSDGNGQAHVHVHTHPHSHGVGSDRCSAYDLPIVSNGYIESINYEASEVGTLRPVKCFDGFYIVGNNAVMCLNNGQWSAPGQCYRDNADPYSKFCTGNLPTIPNGYVADGTNEVGTSRAVYCEFGYDLYGPSFIFCDSTQQWSLPGSCFESQQLETTTRRQPVTNYIMNGANPKNTPFFLNIICSLLAITIATTSSSILYLLQ